jgi:uncharacterized protein
MIRHTHLSQSCGGCTSGHMLCGISRLSPLSILATAIFFSAAAITFHLSNPSLSTRVCPDNEPCYHISSPILSKSPTLSVLLVLGALSVEVVPRLLSKFSSKDAARRITYLLTGFTFGLGLLVSGMASPEKVQAFFGFSLFPPNITHWDPSLALIIVFGIIPNIARIQWRGFAKAPAYTDAFSLPTKTLVDVDATFVLGAVAFGVGWGLTGVCPGPAVLRAVGQPLWGLLWFSGFWVGSQQLSCWREPVAPAQSTAREPLLNSAAS